MIAALSVSAQDDEAPTVTGPKDRPGADVIIKEGSAYTLNMTGSRDNVGIVLYSWEITAPDDTVTTVTSTTPTTSWTPAMAGVHKVLSYAEDADGNKGYYVYAVDVVEVILAQQISNTDVSYDHSVAVTAGTLEYTNTNIEVTGGRKGETVALARGEQISDSLTFKGIGGGKLAGYWAPYNTGGYYGYVYEDTSMKLTGKCSIRNSGGNYQYGFCYYFDQPEDLSDYNAIVFWVHSSYTSCRFYYCYIYTSGGYYYRYMYLGYTPMQRGWYGVYFDMDWQNIGYGSENNINDFQDVTYIRFYMYNYNGNGWIDCVYFDKTPRGDNMTESANPSGPMGGRWDGFSVSSHSIVGSNSVTRSVGSSYQNLYYRFTSPVDLTNFNALKMYTYYTYYYAYIYYFYLYDSNNRYISYYMSSYTYFHYYAAYYYGRWHTLNLPLDHNAWYSGYRDFDWTQVSYMRMYVYFYSSGTIHIDGMEFYQSQGATTEGPPGLAENVPHGIYALEDGELKMTGSSFYSPEVWGAFVHCENRLEIKSTSFDGLWGTTHEAIKNEGQTYGGILAFGANRVILNDVTITRASSSGFYIENSNLDARNLDLSGTSRDFPMGASLIVAFSDTAIGQQHTVSVTACDFHDSPQGSGLMVLSQNARGDATVDIDDVTAFKNMVYGVVMEVVGWTGNLTVSVTDSDFELNQGSGFSFVAHDAKWTPRTLVKFKVDGSDAVENGAYGFLFVVDKADIRATGTLTGLESTDNTGNGIGFNVNRFSGELTINFDEISSYENLGNGVYIDSQQANFRDITGSQIHGAGKLYINFNGGSIEGNEGHGVYEQYGAQASSTESPRPTCYVELVADGLVVEQNEGHGYRAGARGRPQYGGHDLNHEFLNCLFSDNDGAGFDSYIAYYNPSNYGESEDRLYFDNCTFTYNNRGFQQYYEQTSYQAESWVKMKGCTFQDNDYEAVKAWGYWYSSYDSGYSFMEGVEIDIQDSLLDGFVSLFPSGFYDYSGRVDTWCNIYLINNTYTSDQPMEIMTDMYMYSYISPLAVNVVYKSNVHTSPSTGNGIHMELYGGVKLNGRVLIEDITINNPLGHGVYVRFGTKYSYTSYLRMATGQVRLVDVNINDPLEDGMFIETWHRTPQGAQSGGYYSLLRTNVRGARTGVNTADFDGEIRECRFSNIREATIYTYFGVVDVFDSEIGEISEYNLQVDEKGAIRLWFELRVRVVWRDNPEDAVEGTTVEIKDNSWNILGVNTISDLEGIVFSNLNSYTVLPEGIFTKNPYIATADYIGIVKEVQAQIAENTEITIKLVDDIAPRLTIESPKDGQEQREETVEVKGTAYDKHTGIDRVEVSIDGENWWEAELSPDRFTFTYTIEDIPEGLNLIRVKAYDRAGNSKEGAISMLVDSTPPNLNVITPTDGMRTNKRFLEIVGTTDVGAQVYINDQPIEIQYTLISHQVVLAEGPNAIKVAAVDYLGNINEVVRYVNLDTQAPYVALVNVEDGQRVKSAKLHVIGLAETEDVTVMVMGKEVEIDDEGRFELDITLSEGSNDLEIYAFDGVMNERTIRVTVHLDKTEPWLKLVEPSASTLTMKDITVAGFVELGARVFVNEREVDVSFGYFTTTVSATEGEFELMVSAQDAAGNEHTMTVPLLIDTIAPAIEVTFPPDDHVTNMETLEVRGSILGTENEDARYLELFINGIPRLFDFSTGAFAQELLLEEGVNRIVVMGIDPAGNSYAVTRTVMLDSKAPYLNVELGNTRIDPNWNEPVSLSDFVYVFGFTEIGSSLTVNGIAVEVDAVTGSFNYSYNLPSPAGGLKISTTDIVVVATDEAGNSATMTKTVNRLEGVSVEKEEKTSTAEWMILILALVIFGLSFAGAIGYQRIQAQEELIESYESMPPPPEVTPEGKVLAPPPARPARGGRARQRPRPPEAEEEELDLDEDEAVIDLDEDEEV